MTSQLDTSGWVRGSALPKTYSRTLRTHVEWSDLDPFTQGYVEALFAGRVIWQEPGDSPDAPPFLAKITRRHAPIGDPEFGPSLELEHPDGDFTAFSDEIRAPSFSDLAPETLARIIEDCASFESVYTGGPYADDVRERSGRRFWEGRLRGAFPAFPPLTVTLGDDGKVRFA